MFKGARRSEKRVNINTAGERELAEVADIGPRRARRVIEYRERHGTFRSIDQLTEVPGFAETLTDNLRRTIKV
jgi:competence protein ComEA